MITNIFITILSLGLSYAVFFFFLRPVKTFKFNRFYLLMTLVLCCVFPFLEIEILQLKPDILNVNIQNNTDSAADFTSQEISSKILEDKVNLFSSTLFYVFGLVSLVLLFRFVRNLIRILRLCNRPKTKIGKLWQVPINNREQPCSFFNLLFASHSILSVKKYRDLIIAHESVHASELHSLDVLTVELLTCFFWYNPFIWLYKKAVIQNHEYIADQEAVNSGITLDFYSKSMIQNPYQANRLALSSGFYFHQIKKRIIMLHQNKSSMKSRAFRILIATALFAGVFLFSAFKELKPPLVVVVDAGHGGHDSGNLNEKDIVLKISKALATMQDDRIKIIQTRNDDNFLTLKQRVDFINSQNPDLFISLHCNSHMDSKLEGIEIFTGQNPINYKHSMGYGWLLMNQQLENGVFSNGEMKNANFYLLKNAEVPGIFMEMGFMSNEQDSKKLNSAEGQDAMAKAIFDGLLEIRDKKELIDLIGNK